MERWESSGGKDILSNVTDHIPQETKEFMSQAKNRFFNVAHIRTPSVFFGFGEEKPFFLEKSTGLLVPRLRHNFTFFYLNYMIIVAMFFILTFVVTPTAVFSSALLALAWAALIRATKDGSIKWKKITITQKQAIVAMSGISLLYLFYFLQGVFWWSFGTSGFLIAAHAFFRDASMHRDEEDKVDMTGDFQVAEEDAPFLNPAETV